MASHEVFPDEAAAVDPVQSLGGAADARPLDRIGRRGRDLVRAAKSRQVVVAVAAVGAVAAAVVGAKIARDRRKSEKVYVRAVHQLEDAKDSLFAAAAELPERGRATLERVTHR